MLLLGAMASFFLYSRNKIGNYFNPVKVDVSSSGVPVATSFLNSVNVRDHDVHGFGNYGASRGDHDHKGQDFKCNVGYGFPAPFDCVVKRVGFVYQGSIKWRLLEIIGTTGTFRNWKAKLMYLQDDSNIDKEYKKLDLIGKCQNISEKYAGITPHVHVELYTPLGVIVDPMKHLI